MKPVQPKNWDRDKVWDDIERKLRKRKKRRGFLWFWLGSATIGAALVFFLWIGQRHKAIETDALIATNNTLIESNTQKNNIKQGTSSTNKATEENVNPLRAEEQIRSNKVTREAMKNSSIQSFNSVPLSPTNTTNTKVRQIEKEIGTSSTPSLTPITPNENYSLPLSSQKIIQKQQADILPLDLPFNLISYTWSLNDQQLENNLEVVEKNSTPFLFRVASSIGTGRVQYLGSEVWQAAKEESESFEFTTTTTIGLDWYFAKNTYLYTGLNDQIIQSRYDFTTVQTSTSFIESDSAIVYNLGNELAYEPGILEQTSTSRRSIIHNNTLHRLSILLGLGYTKSIGRFQLETRVGIQAQFMQEFKGITLDENTSLHIFNNRASNERYYSDRLRLGLNTALFVNYRFLPRNYLFLGLQHERDGKASRTAIPLQSNYQIWGIHLGWKGRF